MTDASESLIFLPGASGNREFWKPVSAGLRHPGARRFMTWPGFGGAPREPGVNGIDDLVARVTREITGPVALLAQSMGGVVAVRAALEKPRLVRRLVLSVTSGGIDVASLGATDWRPTFVKNNPGCRAGSSTNGTISRRASTRSRSPFCSSGETPTRSAR
jgi:pimeloyl-ACP methyl ester carboxylesterase